MYNPQLKTFLTVCDCGSFSKAANLLFLTPSAVLHQIRTLEKDLGTELFLRTSKGVSLTPSGLFLEQRARPFIRMGDEIRQGLRELSSDENSICIGTSVLEKCRLLYDLWVLFSAEEPGCQIRMSNIDVEHHIPENTDLIESFNSEAFWMREWSFLEICQVPFGFAVVRDHPLAGKALLTLDDLRGKTVHTINNGSCETITISAGKQSTPSTTAPARRSPLCSACCARTRSTSSITMVRAWICSGSRPLPGMCSWFPCASMIFSST